MAPRTLSVLLALAALADCQALDSAANGTTASAEPAVVYNSTAWAEVGVLRGSQAATPSSASARQALDSAANGTAARLRGSQAAATAGSSTQERFYASAREWELLQLMNQRRSQGGSCGGRSYAPIVRPLIFDCRLWSAAVGHSQYMADNDYYSLTTREGDSPYDLARDRGISADQEGISGGPRSAQEELDELYSSDAGCEDLMNPSYTMIGVGYAYNSASRYQDYWTMLRKIDDVGADDSCYP